MAKKKKHPQVADRQEIQIILGKLMKKAQGINLKLSGEKVRCSILDELDEGLILRMDAEVREQHGLQPRMPIAMNFYYEGKEYYGGSKVLGYGKYEGKEALRLAYPESFNINDDFGLTQLHLTPRIPVTFTSTLNKLCDGQIVNIGVNGIDLKNGENEPTKELLALNIDTNVGFEISPELRIHCPGNLLYIQTFGEGLVGIEFIGLDKETSKKLGDWITEESLKRRNQDLHFLRERRNRKDKPKPNAGNSQAEGEGEAKLRLEDDYGNTVYSDGEAYILILSRDKDLIGRMGKSLKRKYGVLISKGRFSNAQKIIEHYQPVLILIDANLGALSGFDVCNTMQSHLEEKQAVVIMGAGGEELNLFRARAIQGGAFDYIVNDPFRPLSFFKTVEEFVALATDQP
ncbi:response regulator [Acanthopleuribacter pedis]|uniref:Response regulatory domain-containing protein n=1 Tax=Acanthopleuribacter pedis TaxID=442870 RepID=A0A8J7Q7N6_9BACT|nr:response regulator [Acanthopleuribacter pedis]MBO1322237.1 hypothetical protein [Acanthopleuribacter pedis]